MPVAVSAEGASSGFGPQVCAPDGSRAAARRGVWGRATARGDLAIIGPHLLTAFPALAVLRRIGIEVPMASVLGRSGVGAINDAITIRSITVGTGVGFSAISLTCKVAVARSWRSRSSR